jgi:siderophore ferric iron reductase
MTPPGRPNLMRLVETAERVLPGWRGTLSAGMQPPWSAPGAGELRALHAHWARRHPEAGPHYWALRGWGLLIWQPVYLSVIAVHLCSLCPRSHALRQSPGGGELGDYALLADEAPFEGDEAACLRLAAAQLAEGCEALLHAWREQAALHPKAARRTLADATLAALLAVQRHERRAGSACEARLLQRGAAWLAALQLPGESGYFRYQDAAGAEQLALDRKVCCLHFRRHDGERCSTCPKRTLPERIACLNLE